MKIFLLFLFMSFIVGVNLQQAKPQRQRRVMGSLVAVMVTAYFLFDQLI